MYYPVTDAAMDTGSYEQFAEGHFFTAKAMRLGCRPDTAPRLRSPP
jgi:hypothetical protein